MKWDKLQSKIKKTLSEINTAPLIERLELLKRLDELLIARDPLIRETEKRVRGII